MAAKILKKLKSCLFNKCKISVGNLDKNERDFISMVYHRNPNDLTNLPLTGYMLIDLYWRNRF